MTAPRVSAIVVSYESRDELGACLASLAAPGVETIVVDNASRDGSADLVAREHPDARLLRNRSNAGFGRGCNQGAALAGAPYLLFLNPDARLEAGALDALARVLEEDAGAGVVGPRTLNDDGTPQVSFGPALGLLSEWRQRRLVRGVRARDPEVLRRVEAMTSAAAEPDWVSGSCLLVRRRAFEQVGGFDEAFFLYEEDVDLCVRLRAAGWRVRFEPGAVVRHALGRSMARNPMKARIEYLRSHLHYYRKHNGPVATAILSAGMRLQALGRLVIGLVRPRPRREDRQK
jgi:GT2 family glycosyltransferase